MLARISDNPWNYYWHISTYTSSFHTSLTTCMGGTNTTTSMAGSWNHNHLANCTPKAFQTQYLKHVNIFIFCPQLRCYTQHRLVQWQPRTHMIEIYLSSWDYSPSQPLAARSFQGRKKAEPWESVEKQEMYRQSYQILSINLKSANSRQSKTLKSNTL